LAGLDVVGTVPIIDPYVFGQSWLGDVPPPDRPLLLFDGG
jgi:hypothetical protein